MDRQVYFNMASKLISVATILGRDFDAIFFILRYVRMLLHLRDQISQTTRPRATVPRAKTVSMLNQRPSFLRVYSSGWAGRMEALPL